LTLAPQIEELRETDDSQAETAVTKPSSNGAKRNPPARNTSRFWFERFLAIIQRQNPSVIDAAFLSQIAPSNEGKLLSQLKYLKVIDEQGKPTTLLPLLNLVGDAQKKGFQQMVEESYSELLSEVKVEKAVADDLVNFFIRKYSYTRDKATYASKFFLYLAEKGSLQLSSELASFLAEKSSANNNSAGPASASGVAVRSAAERPARNLPKIANPMTKSAQSSKLFANTQSNVQATIEIKLDKDTPREYWDRVLALLGESRNEDAEPSQDRKHSQ
jgi:hypothetical protein